MMTGLAFALLGFSLDRIFNPRLERDVSAWLKQKTLTCRKPDAVFPHHAGAVQAVDGVDFDLDYNRAVVILGESGCGKTSLAKAILRLLPRNVGDLLRRRSTWTVWM